MDRIKGIADEYKNMSEEEKKANTKSPDELFDEDEVELLSQMFTTFATIIANTHGFKH
ncbi:MAG: hypothetical protein L3J31_04065 [Bacteroidales bacterium]|nr:hypothetical protein [Bacteroidales bacterium]